MDKYGNYLGILKWTLAQTDGGAPTTEAKPMSAEDKAFLENAMKELTVDQVEDMKNIIKVLAKEDGEDTFEEKRDALDKLQDIVGFIDYARGGYHVCDTSCYCHDTHDVHPDFFIVGGYGPLALCLRSKDPEVRGQAAGVFAELLQNHPKTQGWALEQGLLQDLLKLTEEESSAPVMAKLFLAISAMVGSFAPAKQVFVESNGLAILEEVLQSESSSLVRRAVLLTRRLFVGLGAKECKEKAKDTKLISQLLKLLSHSDIDVREHAAGALVEFAAKTVLAPEEMGQSSVSQGGPAITHAEDLPAADAPAEEKKTEVQAPAPSPSESKGEATSTALMVVPDTTSPVDVDSEALAGARREVMKAAGAMEAISNRLAAIATLTGEDRECVQQEEGMLTVLKKALDN